jgi:hypothetical protein
VGRVSLAGISVMMGAGVLGEAQALMSRLNAINSKSLIFITFSFG